MKDDQAYSNTLQLISITDASKMLNIHPNTLRRWDRDGQLKAVRLGTRGDRSYLLEEIKALSQTRNEGVLEANGVFQQTSLESLVTHLSQASNQFLQPLTLTETAEFIVNEAKRIVGAEFGSLFLVRDGELERIYSSAQVLYTVKPRRKGHTNQVLKSKSTEYYLVKDHDDAHQLIKDLGVKSVIHIPLIYDEEPVGVINLLRMERESLTKQELEVLNVFGNLASLAIKKAESLSS